MNLLNLSIDDDQRYKIFRHHSYASVACILQIKLNTVLDSIKSDSNINYYTKDNIKELLYNKRNINNISFKLLLIKRSTRSGDPWSGDIALPGGHIEVNETSKDAAIRETYEEIGLNINSSNFLWLGLLPTRSITKHKRRVVVYPHVFLYLGKNNTIADIDLMLDINKDEVYHAWWIYADFLTSTINPIDSYSHNIKDKYINPALHKKLLLNFIFSFIFKYILSMKHIEFPCYQLDIPLNIQNNIHESSNNWILWGLTFNILNDLRKSITSNYHNVKLSSLSNQTKIIVGFSFDNTIINFVLLSIHYIYRRIGLNPNYVTLLRTLFGSFIVTFLLSIVLFSVFIR